MSDELRTQIYNNLNLKETEKLLEIWKTNDHVEWSDSAFEIIRDILEKRTVEVPSQDEPIYEYSEQKVEVDEDLEEWEAKLLDNDDQPEFYDTIEVLALRDNINKTLKALIIVYALSGLTTVQWLSSILSSYFPNNDEITPVIYLISAGFMIAGTAISIAIIYFPLKALTHILRILMEMEFNSRKAKS